MTRHIKLMNIGPTGSGKTHNGASFPNSYFLITEPGAEETFLNKPELKKNVVKYKHFIPTDEKDTMRVFKEMNEACIEARQLAKEGKIETLVLDNATYTMENRWVYINEYEKEFTKLGGIDTRGMYGKLRRWAYTFILMKMLSFPGHVVVNVHEALESDEALEKKSDKNYPVVPSILGGFRDDMPGMFSCVFYLSCRKDKDKYRYFARTKKGMGKLAKNRYNLPEVIEDVSYSTIMRAMKESEGEVK